LPVFGYRGGEAGRGRIKDGRNSSKTPLVGVAAPIEATGATQRDDFCQKLDRLLQRRSLPEMALEAGSDVSAPALPQRDDTEATLELVGAAAPTGKLVGWAGSEDSLQEAIDA